MHSVGVNTAEMRTIKRILSAILHLGNVTFKDNGEGHISTVNGDKSRQHMEWACELLGIDKVRIWSQAILICKALQRQHYFSIFCAFSCPVLHVKRIGPGSVRALDVQLENRNNGCSSPALRGQSLVFVLVFSLAFLSCLFAFHAFLRWTPVATRLPSCFTPRCSSGSSPASTPASSQRAPAARSTFWIYLASKTLPTTHLSRFFATSACCSFA